MCEKAYRLQNHVARFTLKALVEYMMTRIETLVSSYKDEIRGQAEDAALLSQNLLALLQFEARLPEEQLKGAPEFVRSFYIPSQVYVCMGALRNADGTISEMTHTGEIVVDGRDQGWVLTRTGLFRLKHHMGTYK
jgi:hypothetical protein